MVILRPVLASIFLACGTQGGPSTDAGSEADVRVGKACDFPCFRPWRCAGSTNWIAQESFMPPECTSGMTCIVVGDAQACDPGETCDDEDAPRDAGTPCITLDAGAD